MSAGAGHLSPELVAATAGGRLAGDERGAVEAHLEGCAECRAAVAALLRAVEPTDAALTIARSVGRAYAPAAPLLARGSAIGRFIVLAPLGAGGMGVVYAAYDPELDRRVAIKLVKHRGGRDADERARRRLLREAQAMARLGHPNVIPVYDVGVIATDAGDDVFIAMEHVDGLTLRGWLEARPRAADEIVATFVQAGRGLAAAHAAGLIHRDFKPDNVLVGNDGRVRVLDFGLARGEDAVEESGEGAPGAEALDADLTKTGALLGTPAYMAPEQRAGGRADARSDQFGFCVALYEALTGERPAAGGGAAALARLPPWIRRALERGLAEAPAARFADMDALLAALEARPARARRLGAYAGVALACASVLGAAGYQRYARRDVCGGAAERLAGVWDASVRARIERAFAATGAPFAGAAVSGVTRAFDEYARAWTQMHRQACEATHLYKLQSAELLDLRMACLDERRDEWKAESDLFTRADRQVVENAVRAASALSDLAPCANAQALRATLRPPADAATRARVEALRRRLAEDKSILEAGKYKDGRPLARQLAGEARAIGYAPALAEALYLLGRFEYLDGDSAAAAPTLQAAIAAAERGHHDEVLALALLEYLRAEGMGLGKLDDALGWQGLAAAAVARVASAELSAQLDYRLGQLYYEKDLLKDAEAADARAVAALAKIGRPIDHAYALAELASVYLADNRFDVAETSYERVMTLLETSVGTAHPFYASTLGNLANLYAQEGKPKQAEAAHARVVALYESSLGEAHWGFGLSLSALAADRRALGNFRQALADDERAVAVHEKIGQPSRYLAFALSGVGEDELGLGRPAAAIAPLERALAIYAHAEGEGIAGEQADAKATLAKALWAVGKDRPRARALAVEAERAYAAHGDKKEAAGVARWLADK